MGLSQERLAHNADCSKDSIRKFEQGVQPIGNTPLTERLAQSLGTTTIELLLTDSGLEDQNGCVNRFKLALTSRTGHSTSLGRVTTRQVRDLETRVEKALTFATTGAYRELSVVLPRLISNLDTARGQATNNRTVKTVLRLLAEVFLATSEVMNELHEHDVAVIAANQAIIAGKEWGDHATGKCLVLRGHTVKARALLESGYPLRARNALRDGIPLYKDLEGLNDWEPVEAVGSWLLMFAELDARAGNGDNVATRLETARRLAQRASEVPNKQVQTFTTSTVAMAAMRLAVEVGNGTLALDYARDMPWESLTPEQRARTLIDATRAHLLLGSPEKALESLLEAEEFAPEELIKRGAVVAIIAEVQSHVVEPHLTTLHDFVNRLYG